MKFIKTVITILTVLTVISCKDNKVYTNNTDPIHDNPSELTGRWVNDQDKPLCARLTTRNGYVMTSFGIITDEMFLDIINQFLETELNIKCFSISYDTTKTSKDHNISMTVRLSDHNITREGFYDRKTNTIFFQTDFEDTNHKSSENSSIKANPDKNRQTFPVITFSIDSTDIKDKLCLSIGKSDFLYLADQYTDSEILDLLENTDDFKICLNLEKDIQTDL